MKRHIDDETIEGIITSVFVVLFIVLITATVIHERKNDKEYGEKSYEFVIIDKYEDIGSRWHLIGGRASETMYHIVYKSRCTNRPDETNVTKCDKSVDKMTYDSYEIGETFTTSSEFLPR